MYLHSSHLADFFTCTLSALSLHGEQRTNPSTRVMIHGSSPRIADESLTVNTTACGTLFTRLIRPIITMIMTTHLQLNAVCKPMNPNMYTELAKKKKKNSTCPSSIHRLQTVKVTLLITVDSMGQCNLLSLMLLNRILLPPPLCFSPHPPHSIFTGLKLYAPLSS